MIVRNELGLQLEQSKEVDIRQVLQELSHFEQLWELMNIWVGSGL